MDENKARVRRRRSIGAGQSLEALEGRQLMAANAAQVGFQEDASSGTNILLIGGTNKADVIRIDDNGTGAAGNITVTLGNGNVYTSRSAIAQIQVLGKGGNDQVSYNLNGNLVAPRSVLVDLGAGNDKFSANLAGSIASTNGLDVEVYGGAGNDTMSTTQTGANLVGNAVVYFQGDAGNDNLSYNGVGAIAPGASFSPEFSGGSGNDTIRSSYAGIDNGYFSYNLSADGGSGNDNITSNVALAAGSTGSVGSSSSMPSAITGGTGNDKIQMSVVVDPAAPTARVFAVAVGGKGKDTVAKTANVSTDPSNEVTSTLA